MSRPSVLAAAISKSMTESTGELVVFESEKKEWRRYPWKDVYARAEKIAHEISKNPSPVGLIGDPGFDLIATIQGAWLAGTAVTILPGPVRGADTARWAEATVARYENMGVRTVLGSGDQRTILASVSSSLHVVEASEFGTGAEVFEESSAITSPAILQGTAGSTGEPRTAVLSPAAVLANARGLLQRLSVDGRTDIGFTWLPLYHDMGLAFLTANMVSGMSTWIVSNSAFAAAPFKWLDWLTESRATITAAPNFAYDIVGRYGKFLNDADLSSIRVAISGGEPIDPKAFDVFLQQTARFGFDPAAAAPAYGMAESTCAITMPAAGDGARYDDAEVDGSPRRYAVLGRPIDGMEVRIAEAAVETPVIVGRDVGEIEVRGTSMMSGYLGQDSLAESEWFKTGDLGYLVDGSLVICGRAKELVIVAGRNLFPAEIERAAAQVEGVRSGGVVAMAREGTARPGLVMVAEYRGTEQESARSNVIGAVASVCGIVPGDVVFVEAGTLPRTTSGKLRRLEVKRLVETGVLA